MVSYLGNPCTKHIGVLKKFNPNFFFTFQHFYYYILIYCSLALKDTLKHKYKQLILEIDIKCDEAFLKINYEKYLIIILAILVL